MAGKLDHPNAKKEISSDYFDRKDEWFLSTLGALTAQWELAEYHMHLFLCAVTGMNRQSDLLNILNSISPSQKVRMLGDLVDSHIKDKGRKGAARKVLKQYDNLRSRRNSYIHALWMVDPDGANSSPQTFGAISRLKRHSASRMHLRRLCEEIENLIEEIGAFYDSSGQALLIEPEPATFPAES